MIDHTGKASPQIETHADRRNVKFGCLRFSEISKSIVETGDDLTGE